MVVRRRRGGHFGSRAGARDPGVGNRGIDPVCGRRNESQEALPGIANSCLAGGGGAKGTKRLHLEKSLFQGSQSRSARRRHRPSGRLSVIEMMRVICNKDEIRHQALIVLRLQPSFHGHSPLPLLHFQKPQQVFRTIASATFRQSTDESCPKLPPSERLQKIFRDTINAPANAIQRTMDGLWPALFDGLRRRSESPTICMTWMV
jgi:hypothetical protein